jgi:SAM-dependent methyltransferase
MIPLQLHRRIPLVRRPFYQRDMAIAERDRAVLERDKIIAVLEHENAKLRQEIVTLTLLDASANYLDRDAIVLQYRRAHYEAHGTIAPGAALPTARAWPRSDHGLTYEDRLTGLLPIDQVGAEIGPLNIPLLSKSKHRVLYVDHLDTVGLRKKYLSVEGIVEIDRPMINHSLEETLKGDYPLAYICASQVMEHVPDPIRWLNEAATALKVGGLIALSLPDRRFTFDLFRTESRTTDLVAASLNGLKVPDVRAVYDNQLLATAVNVPWITQESSTPDQVFLGRGAVTPTKVQPDHMAQVRLAQAGEYLDEHVWVFTPPNFLMIMAQLVTDGLIPFKCHQFYPTSDGSDGVYDRSLSSFTVVLEKIDGRTSQREARLSFLMALGKR